MADESASALERLDALIGIWKTEGTTTDGLAGRANRIDAVDTYTRLPGGALLHLVDAKVGDRKIGGAEIIGYDPARGSFCTQYFGSDGPNAYEASLVENDGALVWTMRSSKDRFIGAFNDERTVITGHWDVIDDDSNWQSWMDITLTRERAGGEAGGEHDPVPVDDIGALGDRGAEARLLGSARIDAVLQHRHVDQPSADRGEGQGEERRTHQQARTAGLQRPLGGAVELHDLVAPRRHRIGMARTAGRGTGAERLHGFTFLTTPTPPSCVSKATVAGSSEPPAYSSTRGVGRAGKVSKRTICTPATGARSR